MGLCFLDPLESYTVRPKQKVMYMASKNAKKVWVSNRKVLDSKSYTYSGVLAICLLYEYEFLRCVNFHGFVKFINIE